MNRKMVLAHRLAQTILWIEAKESAARSRFKDDLPSKFYDPHAATECGDLIYKTMFQKEPTK